MSKFTSPTARILRSSRLFSLPQPIKGANADISTATALRSSDTATLPYPTHQALATPPSSLSRGDWGLKRNLPLRSTTQTSTPTVRVTQLDSIEQITDFKSAADHARTLQKWQEMEIALSMQQDKRGGLQNRSFLGVFERNVDITDPVAVKDSEVPASTDGGVKKFLQRGGKKIQRWKFDGPWVAGMTDGAFQEFLHGKVKSRQSEFMEFVRTHIRARAIQIRRQQLQERGEDIIDTEGRDIASIKCQDEFTEEFFNHHLRIMRDDTALNSELNRLIRDFLDLPAGEKVSEYVPGFDEVGPPQTHPSAGLSYLRSDAFLVNHPVLGPRAHRKPIQARVLKATRTAVAANTQPTLGVGGVVAKNAERSAISAHQNDYFGEKHDFEEYGGNKVWVEPVEASIDSKGIIQLNVRKADERNVDVYLGKKEVLNVNVPGQTPSHVRQTGFAGRFNEPFDSKTDSLL